ncbi:MAG: dihydropteroate synthase, partial [Acetobacteraceae bacterium]
GAVMVNDVSGLTHDPRSAAVVAEAGCAVVLMHMRGTPRSMSSLTDYADVALDVHDELAARLAAALRAGIARERIVLDPGIGFAKTAEQNLVLLRRLALFRSFGRPLLVGVSRKGFIGRIADEPEPKRRLGGSLAAGLVAAINGASILRVHDVAETVQALKVWRAIGTA